MPKLAIDNCTCCNSTKVACVVLPAGVLPKVATCKKCDTNGLFIALSTYKPVK